VCRSQIAVTVLDLYLTNEELVFYGKNIDITWPEELGTLKLKRYYAASGDRPLHGTKGSAIGVWCLKAKLDSNPI